MMMQFILFFCMANVSLSSMVIKQYGIQSGSTQTYTSNEIREYNTQIVISFLSAFDVSPKCVVSFADYQDLTTSPKIQFAIKIQSSSQSKVILRFYFANNQYTYPVTLRLRYFAWDSNIFPFLVQNRQSKTSNLGILNIVSIDFSLSQGSMFTSTKICFITGILNFAPNTIMDIQIQVECVIFVGSATNLKINVAVSPKNYNIAQQKVVLFSVFIVPPRADLYNPVTNILQSQDGTPSVHPTNLDLPNVYYIVGLSVFYYRSRIFSAFLTDNDRAIDNTKTYHKLNYPFIVIILPATAASAINIGRIRIDTFNPIIDIRYNNIDNSESITYSNFLIMNPKLNFNGIKGNNNDKILRLGLRYSSQLDNNENIDITYKITTPSKMQASFKTSYVVLVSKTVMDIFSETLLITINNIPDSDISISNDYHINSEYSQNHFSASNGLVNINYSYPHDSYKQGILLEIINLDPQSQVVVNTLKIQQLHVIQNENKIIIQLLGLDRSKSILSSSQFFLLSSNQTFISVNYNQNIISANNILEHLSNVFHINFKPVLTKHQLQLENIRFFTSKHIQMKSENKNQIKIVLKNTFNLNITESELLFEQNKIEIDEVETNEENITIKGKFSSTIQDQTVSLIYDTNNNKYKQIFTMKATASQPLLYWSQSRIKSYKFVSQFSQIIQYLYLSIFIISLISMKMVGIQTIQLIQFTFYSLIPIGANSSVTLLGLSKMYYVSGFNPLFSSTSIFKILNNYSVLNLKSNFLSNVNLMISFVLICPFIFGIFHVLSNYSNNYKRKPQFQRCSKMFLIEIPFAILLFNSFNVWISFVINVQYYKDSSISSLIVSIIIIMIMIIASVVLVIYQKHLGQFNQEIQQSSIVFGLTIKKSTAIRKIYPILMAIQLTLVPLFLSIQSVFNSSLYIVFTITVLISVYILISTPYHHQIDNWRLLIHRFLLLVIVILQMVTKIVINKSSQQSIQFYLNSYSYIILIVLILGLIINGPYIIWKTYLWIRKPGTIDLKLYIQQHGTKQNPNAMKLLMNEGVSFPKLQYGVGRQKKIFRQKKRIFSKNDKNKSSLSKYEQQDQILQQK